MAARVALLGQTMLVSKILAKQLSGGLLFSISRSSLGAVVCCGSAFTLSYTHAGPLEK